LIANREVGGDAGGDLSAFVSGARGGGERNLSSPPPGMLLLP
jgi:hypothetical protein